MDTASNVPFTLQLIKKFPYRVEQNAKAFFLDEHQMWKQDVVTLSVEENDEIQLYFNAEDKDARLYLDALDIMPVDEQNTRVDEKGHMYRKPMEQPFTLYKSNAGYDALRIDTFKISIFCEGQMYYGTFQILPKPMSTSEWNMMKDDLEQEIRGLAQDIVRRNIGLGDARKGNLPPKVLYDFFVIKRYSKNVMMALIDIADNPRSEIRTQYDKVSVNMKKNYAFDAETVKQYVVRGGAVATYKVPKKAICYDIQDNRLLKNIILEYEQKLDQFVELLDKVNCFSISASVNGSNQYQNEWRESISEFRETALKLRKMTSVLKTNEWYHEVADLQRPYIPHSFIMDSRYNIVYQMYMDLKKEQIQIDLDPEFSYTWKRSSYLYEMWSYLKICHILAEQYEINTGDFNFMFSDKVLFPFLKRGTRVSFEDADVRIEVIFDRILPTGQKDTNADEPLYIARPHNNIGMHNRPDIVLNVFDKEKGWYLGSIILECKYRKLFSFWSEDSKWSSRNQLEAYYNNARSEYLYGDLGSFWQIHPVKKVIVLTPDNGGEGREQKDFNILVKGFKPSEGDVLGESVKEVLLSEIQKARDAGEKLKNFKNQI